MRLGSVQDAALAAAEAEAGAVSRTAERDAAGLLAAARAEAAALLDRRRAAAALLADSERAERLAQARGHARAIVLRARVAVLAEATEAAHAAARRLAGGPAGEARRKQMAAEMRSRLAAAGPVEVQPTPDGGLVARAGSLEIDCSLHAQVERCLQDMSGEIERLWR